MKYIDRIINEIKISNKMDCIEITFPYSFHHGKNMTLYITSEDNYEFVLSDQGYTISCIKDYDKYKDKIFEILSMHGDIWIENNCIKTNLPSLKTNATNKALFSYLSVLSTIYHVHLFPILEKDARTF